MFWQQQPTPFGWQPRPLPSAVPVLCPEAAAPAPGLDHLGFGPHGPAEGPEPRAGDGEPVEDSPVQQLQKLGCETQFVWSICAETGRQVVELYLAEEAAVGLPLARREGSSKKHLKQQVCTGPVRVYLPEADVCVCVWAQDGMPHRFFAVLVSGPGVLCQGLLVFEVTVGQYDVSFLPSLPFAAERHLMAPDMSHVWLANWPELIFSTRAPRATHNNVSVFAGSEFGWSWLA